MQAGETDGVFAELAGRWGVAELAVAKTVFD